MEVSNLANESWDDSWLLCLNLPSLSNLWIDMLVKIEKIYTSDVDGDIECIFC